MKPIHIFSRQCVFSKVSHAKNRIPGFSKEACYRNLKETANAEHVEFHFLLDGDSSGHFIADEPSLLQFDGGTETRSFLFMLDHILSLGLDDETIIYSVEDDYIHKPGWTTVLQEPFERGIEHVTLYDHYDKYTPMYDGLSSQIIATKSCHWRTTPSTTNTFAVKLKTLKKYEETYRKYSNKDELISRDHDRFLDLWKQGSSLVSAVPGFSTHMEPELESPFTNWKEIHDKHLHIHTR